MRLKMDPDNNSEHMIPASKYIWIEPDIAIHKTFTLYYTLTVFAFTCILWAIGLYTEWYQTAGAKLHSFFIIQYPLLTVGFASMCTLTVYILIRSYKKQKNQRK